MFSICSLLEVKLRRCMMTSAQVVETSVNVTNNSPSRDYSHPDDQTTQTTMYFDVRNQLVISDSM